MNTIFFDLETSDLNFAGQILNYAFFEVDDQWNVISETKGNVKISKLQLPVPEAILANKIDVIEHQNSCSINETEATLQIYNLINRSISSQDFTKLIGYNSNSFDVPYLRTSMIRNGLNPYFGGNLHYGDLLHVVKKLSLTDESFRARLRKKDDGRAILTLESVCKSFGILKDDEVQKHESEFDVLITIKLAKFIFDNYGIDVRTYDSYEVEKRPTSFDCVKFVSDIDSKNFSSEDYSYYTLLEQNRTQSLWINLKLFDDGLDKKSITWFNKNTSQLLVDEYLVDDEFRSRSQKARDSL